MKKIAIELKDYSFKYMNTDKWILDNANFQLNYGELVVLSGLSGEGKSTLLHSINGIIPNIVNGEQKGSLYINEENIQGLKASDISIKLGSVLQNADSQIINSRIEDEIAFGCENLNMDIEDISKAIESSCDLMSLNKSWITKTLSGGQKQRLITASILAMNQKILVFDEPLANLDLEGAHLLLGVLSDLTKEGYAVLLIEHRLDVVVPYADRIAWMKDGKVQFWNDKQQAIENSKKLFYVSKKEKSKKTNIEPCFILKDLSYSIDDRDILKNLNITINKGERVVILGENGCGKTTLLKLISRMIKPVDGEMNQFIQKPTKKTNTQWFKKLGFVYQNPSYQLFMPTVFDEINYQSIGLEKTNEMLDKFNLEVFKNRHPQSLSEGQKRRLTIACALAMNPEVLLLDEPTVGQDYNGLRNIIETLNKIHDENNNTMITITHDFRCAEALADKVIWMNKGQVYKIGGPELAEEYFHEQIGYVNKNIS